MKTANPTRHTRLPATTTGRDVFSELDRLQDELRTHLDRWRDLDLFDGAFTPVADVEETNDAYLVEIELAGVNRTDVDITIAGRRLTVTGERKEKQRVGVLRRKHRTVGEFRYEVELPADFDVDNVTAGLQDGVLSVRLPKTVTDQPRRIPIN